MKSNQNILKKIVLPVVILVAGAIMTGAMILLKSAPEKAERLSQGALVETMDVVFADRQVQVYGTGTVQPSREVGLAAQVGGKVTDVAVNFVAGGFFQKGELMFRLEDADYVLAVEQARAGVAQAELFLATTESRAAIAREEWKNLQKGDEQPNPLVVYEPQLHEARAKLESAKAVLEQSLINLERTAVYAPFNCRIRSESIDPGRIIKAGDSVANVADTDFAEVIVPLPVTEFSWLKIPRAGSGEKGSPAMVRVSTPEGSIEWQGEVARSLGEIDQESRLAPLVVAVPKPYDRAQPFALAPGLFVEVVIQGKIVSDVATLPRNALRDQGNIWVMTPENKLKISKVEVFRQERDLVYIREGIHPGDQVVLTNLSGASNGMILRPLEEEKKP